MRICQIIGTVTLNRAHSSLGRATLKVAVPLTLDELRQAAAPAGEELITCDELGAGVGSCVAISEGREAAMPFQPEHKPVDAYCACILDSVELAGQRVNRST